MLTKDKARALEKIGIEILPGLKDLSTEERIRYGEEFLGLEFLPDNTVEEEFTNIRKGLQGLQEYVVNHTCGHCVRDVSGIIVAKHTEFFVQWSICPNCKGGSVHANGKTLPAPLFGEDIKGLPETIKNAYTEARKSISSESYTACEMMCRKILMNIAVQKGASEDKTFANYIDYMSDKGYVTITMKPWVKQIKDNGNEATHEINQSDFERTNNTLQFTILLLKSVYETEYHMNSCSTSSK